MEVHTGLTLCLLSVFTVFCLAEDCQKLTSCSCKTSAGTFDLHALVDNQLNPRFSSTLDPYAYYWEPCNGMAGGCGTSSLDVAVCQLVSTTPIFVTGYQDKVSFKGNPADGNLQMVYDGDDGRVSTINMVCDENVDGIFKVSSADKPEKHYDFQLTTKYACFGAPAASSGLSTGSVLVIIFFVLLVVYLLAGFMYLKFARKATGSDLIPNKNFWSSLPGLIKDGFRFTCRGCKTDTTYSQI